MLQEKKSKRGAWIALGCVAALLVLVIVLENTMKPTGMLFTVLKKGAVYAVVASSMNLLNGFTGLFSLGQAGFMLLGAYTYAILTIPTADREAVYYLYNGSVINFSLPELLGGGAVGLVLGVLLALLLGGVYLIVRGVIRARIPVAYIATVAVLTVLFPKAGGAEYMLYSIFGGGLFLGAFFMATDYATSPVTKKGQLIYGIGCGLFTVFIRYFGSYNEGVCYSIMVMNCCTALIDKYTKPVRFGVVKSDKKEAAAK